MAGRGRSARGGNNAGRGDGGRGRSGRGTTARIRTVRTGLNKELEGNIFDLGERSSADLMRTTQIKIAQYIGSQYGGDIMGELETKQEFVAPIPQYPKTAESRRLVYQQMVRSQQNNEHENLLRKRTRLAARVAVAREAGEDEEQELLEEQLTELDNNILRAEYDRRANIDLPMTDEEKAEWRLNQKVSGERAGKHLLNQQKAFATIIGQCTQRLQDKMHDDAQWEVISKHQKPLELYSLIERVVMKQTGDEYPPHNLMENLLAVLTLKQQNNQTNAAWYEKLNTRVDVAESVGVQFDNFSCLWEYCCTARGWKEYDTLTTEEQVTIKSDSKERLLAYLLIVNSNSTTTHESVKTNLLEAFIAKRDEYPDTRSDAIALLNKYDERKPPPTSASEGTAFAQKGNKKSGGKEKSNDKSNPKEGTEEKKKGLENVKCFVCDKKGHLASKCPKKKLLSDIDDSSSISSKSSKIDKLEKEIKKANKQFTLLKAQLEESDDSEESDEEQSHFQFLHHFTLANHCVTPDNVHRNVSMKQSNGKFKDMNLRRVILLDNQSTMSLFCNKKLVTDIRKSKELLTLRSNGGSMDVHHIASVNKTTEVWFSTKAITNILSLQDVRRRYHVTYDSYDKSFIVWREDKGLPNMVFKEHSSGLHFYNPNEDEFSFVVTVEENMKPFSKRQVVSASKARTLLAGLAFPSEPDYKWILRSNQVQDCPVTAEDAAVASTIWGKDIPSLKGKTTRKTPPTVPTDIIAIPIEIRELHRMVILSIDVFFVNKIPFFLTLSQKITFTTVTHLANRKIDTIFKALKSIFFYYLQKGFQIVTITADNEFAPLTEKLYELPGAPTLNLTSANEHEPNIERRIRVVKERTRAVRHSVPFTAIPPRMLTHMVFFVVKLLNYFPAKGGVSVQFSPKTIMSGQTLNYNQCSLPFGTYCQVHEEEGPRNSLVARTTGAISVGPSSNRQGGHMFLSLNTARIISRRSWTVIPMTQSVIDKVNSMAADQPRLLTFLDRNGTEIDNGDCIVPSHDEAPHEIPGVIGNAGQIPGVDMDTEIKQSIEEEIEDNLVENDLPNKTTQAADTTTVELEPADKEETFEPHQGSEPESELPTSDAIQVTTPNKKTPTKPQTTSKTERPTRVRKQVETYVPSMKGKAYQYAQMAEMEIQPQIVELVLTQMTLKAAIKMWGNKATNAAEAEMKQLHWRNSFKPVRWKELTEKQKAAILESHIFLTQKRTGEIKGRTVAGGNKQRGYIEKEDASSPTVATESVILTAIIDAKERRDTAIIDVPNAFIQTVVKDKSKRVIIRIRGMLVDLLVKIAPEVYESYVTINSKGDKQILVECLNAIYGTMVASLLYYQKFTNSLKEKGFINNPYDACVWNKQIDGKQCTICFHVDDCKISHKSKVVVDRIIEWLRKDYESIFEDGSGKMKVNRGKVHKYLGMDLDFTTDQQVKISMVDYVKEVITAWDKAPKPNDDGFTLVEPKRVRKGKSCAAPDDLFKVDEDAIKLNTEQSTAFHNIVAKALYMVKRARPDASVSIAFLTTRVRSPDIDDWKKLGHLIEYLRSTVDLPLILGANTSGVLQWYVDASFAVHANMRGHTGGGLSMGRGFPIVSSTKQKLNTRSSTESELIGVDDMMPSILWARYFLKSQGYQVNDNVVFQDNKSTMLLERNGKASSSRRTKHINVRYFFVTDRIAKGEVRVEWCPTKEMIADFMTKPLQGSAFKKFRDLIMGSLSLKEASKMVTRDMDHEGMAHNSK